MDNKALNLNKFTEMENFIGKEEDFYRNCFLPVYDSTSIIDAILTFFKGKSKKEYEGNIMELLGKNAIDIFDKYQVWKGSVSKIFYIYTGGFDGISFKWDNDFIINHISYGRVVEGNEVIERAKEFSRINKLGLKVNVFGNMRGIYYSIDLIDKYTDTPYVGIEKRSTFYNEPVKKLLFV